MGNCCGSVKQVHGTTTKLTSDSIKDIVIDSSTRMRYVALWDFKATSKAEVNLKTGDIVEKAGFQEEVGSEWKFVTVVSGSVHNAGYVPDNFLALLGSVEVEQWYFNHVDRSEAEKLLLGQPDGTFLMRKGGGNAKQLYSCSNRIGSAECLINVLSVAYKNKVKHYEVKTSQDKNPTYSLGFKSFKSLPELVYWFRRTTEGGVCCLLSTPPEKSPPKVPILPVSVEKNWREISRDQIKVDALVGNGKFGVVYRAVWRACPTLQLSVAVKELKTGLISGRQQFLDEAIVMKNLMHENLVRLHGVVSASEPLWIVTEFMKDGSLRYFLRKKENRYRLAEEILINISMQVANGMLYLHARNIIHRDLAARNVLIDVRIEPDDQKKIVAKIADFGMAQLLVGTSVTEKGNILFPVKWTAPEVLESRRFSVASDVWSYAILLYETFTFGDEPYEGMTVEQVRALVIKERTSPTSSRIPSHIDDLMRLCCRDDPEKRITFNSILIFLRKHSGQWSPYERTFQLDRSFESR